jgi:predicted esterase
VLNGFDEKMKTLNVVILSLVAFLSFSAALEAEPTHRDIRYSKEYDRSILDLWSVDSQTPAPLVVYFHGGGFKQGDKASLSRSQMLRKYHPKGVAFASVNYPFLVHTNKDYFKIMNHCAEAVRFLQANAKKYNLDKTRISVSGGSAGALISCHVGHGHNLGIRSVFPIQQPMGTPLMTYPKLRKGGPPIILYNYSGPNDKVHHPDNAALVHKRCKELGVHSLLYGSKQSGLPELPPGLELHDAAMEFFFKSWQLPFPR